MMPPRQSIMNGPSQMHPAPNQQQQPNQTGGVRLTRTSGPGGTTVVHMSPHGGPQNGPPPAPNQQMMMTRMHMGAGRYPDPNVHFVPNAGPMRMDQAPMMTGFGPPGTRMLPPYAGGPGAMNVNRIFLVI